MRIEEIRVCGTVQGVGFRPTVYRLAHILGLKGEVYNDGKGVLIRVSGSEEIITEFVNKLYQECPPLARINQVVRGLYWGEFNFDDFVISPRNF
jgi:hydrogenase maturation protein HypF